MKMIRTVKNFIKKHDGKPAMLYGYKVPGGAYLPHTRVSNTTFIGCRKQLQIADHVFIGHFNFLDCCNGVCIGEGCQITNYISILTHSSHLAIRLYGKSFSETRDLVTYKKGSVEIGRYTFIGPHSVIASGTKIGKGSIVSAFSYVKGNFPDFSIISGNPATVTGSTKYLDQPYLENHSELKKWYDAWVSDLNYP